MPRRKRISRGNIVKGRGCSYVKYELVRTYVGAVAEVEVNRATGEIRVSKFYIVHDCGQIINPNWRESADRRQRHTDRQQNAEGGSHL